MKLTIGKKLYLGFGSVVLITLIFVLFNFNELGKLGKLQDEGAKRANDGTIAASTGRLGEAMYQVVADAEINMDLAKSERDWKNIKSEGIKELDEVKKMADTDEEKAWYKIAEDNFNKFVDLFENQMLPLLMNSNGITTAVRNLDSDADGIITPFSSALKSISASLKKDQDAADKHYDETVSTTIFVSIILTIIGLLTASIIAFYITRGISKPLLEVVSAGERISLGDLPENSLIAKSKDEVGMTVEILNKIVNTLKIKSEELSKIASGDLTVNVSYASDKDQFAMSFDMMLKSLNNSMAQINSAVEQTASGSNQVAQASQALSQGATEQASSLEEITSSITEINSQAKQNAENALEANSLARKALENSLQGNKQMKELVAAMGNITKSAEEIKKIVKVIDDIAFQTNLLALNANVEAARAGKYGKGFAVVAEEVRNLAGRSAISVKETTAMVEEAVKNILSGNNLVEVTAKQLDEISGGANKVADLVEEIATASKEQTQGLEQINQGLGQIDQVTQANTANAEESASAAEELAGQAQQLRGIVAQFKLADEYQNKSGIENKKFGKHLIQNGQKKDRGLITNH